MKAMIFAAGRGSRMGKLTETTPKPLLLVNETRLIEYHLHKLAKIGVSECVINTNHLAEQFPLLLGDGSRYGLKITYSHETEELGTAGGLVNTLAFFKGENFLLVNGDVFTDYDFEKLCQTKLCYKENISTKVPRHPIEKRDLLAHLVLVDNPDHHPEGDFFMADNGLLSLEGDREKLTYAGIALINPTLFASLPKGLRHLGALLRDAIARQEISGEYFSGNWLNVDTPQRLERATQQ